MCSQRAKWLAPERQGSARRLALPLWALVAVGASLLPGCGEGESVTWVGVQDCAVGIPPEAARGSSIAAVQLPLDGALVTPLGSGFSIRNFTLGPIGVAPASFSCEALQVTARFVPLSAAPGSAAAGPGRALELLPFDCRGSDGRSYLLDGEGQGSDDALFFNQTFTAWLGPERATLLCSTRFQRQVAASSAVDAGVLPLGPAEPAPFGPAPGEPAFGPAPSGPEPGEPLAP